jgi:hypothetical protein
VGSSRDGIHFPPTRAPMRRLAAPLQSCCHLQRHYSAQEMRRVEMMKWRTVADGGPCGELHAQPAAPLAPSWTGFGSDAPDENVRHAGWKKHMGNAVGQNFQRRRPLKLFGGPLGGTSGDTLSLYTNRLLVG